MTNKHDAIFDAVLCGIRNEDRASKQDRGTAIGAGLRNNVDDKTLQWVDPARCKMWGRHNRIYDLLTVENCANLIEGRKQQGKQDFPAVGRRTKGDAAHTYEVICGARRHFAISWLRDLSGEEAFRLADIENRDQADISDFERACDYAAAVNHYYGGKQKTMAQRLRVS